MVDREIKEAIEACRPGSDDVSLPDMSQLAEAIGNDADARELFDRSQQCDAAIGQAFRDVPVPDGLSERLLTAVGRTEPLASEAVRPQLEEATAEADMVSPKRSKKGRRSRQRWLHVSAGSVAAIILSVISFLVIYSSGTDEPAANDRLLQDITAWEKRTAEEGWKANSSSAQLDSRPWARSIDARPYGWCQIETQYDKSTIAYRLAPLGEDLAYLFCMKVPASNSKLPKSPPVRPYVSTGRICVGVWRRDDMVYVLAVEGESRYKRFLGSSILIGWMASTPLPLS